MSVVVLLLAAAVGVAFAQETTSGSIAGQVVDAQGGVLPGATVTLTSAQGTKTFVTDSEGRFFAAFLTPGVYSARVALQGFQPLVRDNITVRLGLRVELPLTLQVGAISETVQVTATSPVIDTSTSAVGGTLATDDLARLPVQRTFTDALYLVPGVTGSGGAGRANPSVSGASGLENEYIVDGVNTTNSGYGAVGSYSIVFGSLGTGVPFDFLKEIEVKTGGYEAEYGEATGGVVNVVTKSGSNRVAGSLFGYIHPSALEGTYTPITTVNGTRPEAVNVTGTREGDGGLEIGGPIVRNSVFFFGAADPRWQRTTYIAPDGFPLRSMGGVPQDRKVTPYAGKVTWQITPTHRVDGSVFGDPATGAMGPQRRESPLRTDTAGFSSLDYGGHNQTAKYEGVVTSKWLVEASVSRASNHITETPSVNTWSVEDHTVSPIVRTGGVGFYEQGNDGRNWQYQAKSTNFFDWAGTHQVRYGFLYEDIGYDNVINRTGPSITLSDGTPTATGAEVTILPDPVFGQIYRVTRANITNVRTTTQHYFSFFAQDTYELPHHFTIKPGVRYEQQRLVGNVKDFSWTGNWAPRIGATWDPLGSGRMKIYGNWGRYFAKIPNDLAARALSADASVTLADYFDPQLVQPVPNGVLAADATTHLVTAGLNASDIDPNAQASYEDEWVSGVDYDLRSQLTLSARYLHRNFGRILEDVGTAPMVAYFLGLPGLASVEYFITNPGPQTPVVTDLSATFDQPVHTYDAVELTADKRLSDRWSAQASYRWSRLHGNYEGFFRNDNGQSDPAITSLFDFPTNDPSYAAIGGPQFGFSGDIRYLGQPGPLPLDRPHQVKLYGTYALPMGLNLGVAFNVGSGTPLTALAANPLYGNAGEIPTGPRGSGFQTVDGFMTRTPVVSQLDLHADYRWKMPGSRRLTLMADVFNLFDSQRVTAYDDYVESTFLSSNPDFGSRLVYQLPLQVRLGARFEF
jgi:hypothetical protein